MKYFILVSSIFGVGSLIQNRPNLCINCKYFTYKNSNMDTEIDAKGTDTKANDVKYGKCSYFPKIENNIEYLVSGKSEYAYCYIARKYDDMCGKEGRMYKSLFDDTLE